MVASPGAPGGSIMTALPFLYMIFGAEAGNPDGPICAIMVALYITQDSSHHSNPQSHDKGDHRPKTDRKLIHQTHGCSAGRDGDHRACHMNIGAQPLYICGTFTDMTKSGKTFAILSILWKVFLKAWEQSACHQIRAGSGNQRRAVGKADGYDKQLSGSLAQI